MTDIHYFHTPQKWQKCQEKGIEYDCQKRLLSSAAAFAMPTESKREQEFASLKNIGDSFKRVVIVRDDIMPYYDENGFLIMGLFDFLLHPDSLETV